MAGKEVLEPGDILLLKDTPDNTTWKHKVIKGGQKLTRLAGKKAGSSQFVHALMWVQSSHLAYVQQEIAEASGEGWVRLADLRYGQYECYRCGDADLADAAAQIAVRWSSADRATAKILYSKPSSVFSIVHHSSYGENAIHRAQQYKASVWGDEITWASGGAFCSQFVLACYQGATEVTGGPITGALATDAKHCSVKELQSRLILDGNFRLAYHVTCNRPKGH